MSLVSEALKKAEREAAAREAREKGLPAPLETPLQPYRARRGQSGRRALLPLLALFGGAAAVTLAVLLTRPGAMGPAAPRGATPSALSTSPAAAAAPPSTVAAAPSPPAPNTVAAAAPPADATSVATAAPGVPPPAPRTSAPVESAGTPPAAGRRAREYVRRVDFPDGTKLELGGIAYSEAAPFAYLNGKLLAVGERTAGYTLVRIERELVVVSGEGGELTLRLKPRPAG